MRPGFCIATGVRFWFFDRAGSRAVATDPMRYASRRLPVAIASEELTRSLDLAQILLRVPRNASAPLHVPSQPRPSGRSCERGTAGLNDNYGYALSAQPRESQGRPTTNLDPQPDFVGRRNASAVGDSPVGEGGHSFGVGDEGAGCVDGDGADESSCVVGVGGDELAFRD